MAGPGVLGHFGALVPGQGTAELFGERRDRQRYSVSDGLGAVAGEGGPVFGLLPFAVAWHGWKVSQHREPGGAFNKCPDRGTPTSQGSGHLPSVLALPGRRPRRGFG